MTRRAEGPGLMAAGSPGRAAGAPEPVPAQTGRPIGTR
jgi:hypothetical protein